MCVSTPSRLLEGRVAVVTGGGVGIGKAVCLKLAEQGASVAVLDINKEWAESVATECGGKAFACDVSKQSEVDATIAEVAAAFGRIDILVNNAVRFVFGHLDEPGKGTGTGTDHGIKDSDWETVFGVNVRGPANLIRAVGPIMKKNELTNQEYYQDQGRAPHTINAGSRGAIVNIASVSSFIAQPEFVPYNASKGAVLQLTRCTAMDFGKHKIRVNAICPGTVETPGAYNHMDLLGLTVEQGRADFASGNLLKRQAAPEEIANGVIFLASDMSSFMTGSHIVIDGGQTIG